MSSTTVPNDLPASIPAAPERLAYRLDELANVLGVSRRLLERERSAGRLLKPDVKIGRVPLWRVQSVKDWLARGGK
jgi:hypothetical protein